MEYPLTTEHQIKNFKTYLYLIFSIYTDIR